MAGSILLLEHLITLSAPIWERWLFYGKDRADLTLLQKLEERLLTSGDLRQFLEAILAAVCDRLQAPQAFLATLGESNLELFVTIGGEETPLDESQSVELLQALAENGKGGGLFAWGDYWLVPLHHQGEGAPDLLGLMGVMRQESEKLDKEELEALKTLAERASLALQDRFQQQQAFSSLEALTPQMAMIQRLRAVSRYDSSEMLTSPEALPEQKDLSTWVKDALSHYWGGPKLTESPLLELEVVQQTAQEREENPTNALRAILKQAIEYVKPEGERRFTAEWILYNILEMKFMEGRKVREVAMRLAMSEADLYRKQRVAIEAVANAIVEMEHQVRQEKIENQLQPVQEN
jgi:hypothetical protein